MIDPIINSELSSLSSNFTTNSISSDVLDKNLTETLNDANYGVPAEHNFVNIFNTNNLNEYIYVFIIIYTFISGIVLKVLFNKNKQYIQTIQQKEEKEQKHIQQLEQLKDTVRLLNTLAFLQKAKENLNVEKLYHHTNKSNCEKIKEFLQFTSAKQKEEYHNRRIMRLKGTCDICSQNYDNLLTKYKDKYGYKPSDLM